MVHNTNTVHNNTNMIHSNNTNMYTTQTWYTTTQSTHNTNMVYTNNTNKHGIQQHKHAPQWQHKHGTQQRNHTTQQQHKTIPQMHTGTPPPHLHPPPHTHTHGAHCRQLTRTHQWATGSQVWWSTPLRLAALAGWASQTDRTSHSDGSHLCTYTPHDRRTQETDQMLAQHQAVSETDTVSMKKLTLLLLDAACEWSSPYDINDHF